MVKGMMSKKIVPVLMYYFLVIHLCFSAPTGPSYHILQDMHTFSTYYPRVENSRGERESLSYLRDRLEEIGLPYTVRSLGTYEGFHSFSSTVEVVFPAVNNGQQQGEEKLFLMFPLNHPENAKKEEDGSAGLAIALEVCRGLSTSPPPIEVHVLFPGAEFGEQGQYGLGTQAFLQDFSSHGESALLYVDIRRFTDRLLFQPAGTGKVAPAWLVSFTSDALLRAGLNYDFSTLGFNIHQLAFNEWKTRIDPFLENEIPSIYLASSELGSEEDGPGPTDLSSFLMNFIEDFPRPIPASWDRHYVMFKGDQFSLLLPELSYVLILLVLFAAVLLYPFFQKKRFHRYVRSLKKNGWVLPIIFSLMFLYLLIATFLIEGLSTLRRFPLLWKESPFLLLALKVSFAVFLFTLSHSITFPFHFGRLRGSFYSASGLLFLLINVVLFTLVNLSLTVYGVLLFLLGFLFSLARARTMKLAFLIISIVLTLGLLLQFFREGSSALTYGVLLSRYRGNLLISLQLLPHMLFILRVRMLYHLPSRPKTRRFTLLVELIFGIFSAAVVAYFAFFFTPLSPGGQRLTVTEEINGGHTIRFESPLPLETMDFRSISGQIYSLDISEKSPGRAELRLPSYGELLSVSMKSHVFLGRISYSVDLASPALSVLPKEVHPVLESSGELTIYDSDFPYSIQTKLDRVLFHVGRNPDFPFRFSFTVPAKLEGSLRVEVVCRTPPYDIGIDREKYDLEYTLYAEMLLPIPGEASTDGKAHAVGDIQADRETSTDREQPAIN